MDFRSALGLPGGRQSIVRARVAPWPDRGSAMKGVVFTEFLEMVEARWGFGVVDRIIEAAGLSHDGAYTATGTYDHTEIVRLVAGLSSATGVAVPELIREFGEHLFTSFEASHTELFARVGDVMSFMEQVPGAIHGEVRKLSPDAELPDITCTRDEYGAMDIHYRSQRPFGDLAEGLIVGCIRRFDDDVTLSREDRSTESGSDVVFRLAPRRAA